MPGDIYRKRLYGDPLTFPAELYNKLAEVAQEADFDRSQDEERFWRSNTIIKVRNQSGGNVDQFGILQVDVPTILRTDNSDGFKEQVVCDAITPTGGGKFVILLEPIASGDIGRAVASGVCPVQLSATGVGKSYCDSASANSATLAPADTGSARILWTETTGSDYWALVRFPDSSPGSGTFTDITIEGDTTFEGDIIFVGGTVNWTSTGGATTINVSSDFTWNFGGPIYVTDVPIQKCTLLWCPVLLYVEDASLPTYTRTGNIITETGNGAIPNIDGTAPQAADRLLLNDIADPDNSGIYVVTNVGSGGTPFILTRADDANLSAHFWGGRMVVVTKGTTYADTLWELKTPDDAVAVTLNTTALAFKNLTTIAAPNALLDGSAHSDTVAQGVTRGSLIVGNSTPKWDELVIGAAKKILTSDGTDANWQPAQTSIGFIPPADPGTGTGYTPWGWFTGFDWKCDFSVAEVVPAQMLGVSGGAGAINSVTTATESGHPGVYTHAATAVSDVAYWGNLTTMCFILGGGEYFYEWIVKTPSTLSTGPETYFIRGGITISIGSGATEPTDGYYFLYSHGTNSGKWQYVCRAASSSNVADSGVTVNTSTWYRLTLYFNAAGTATFYIDGANGASPTANLPSVAVGFGGGITKSVGSTARAIISDFAWVHETLTTPR